MKQFVTMLVFLIFSSCIPLRIAPTIDDYKIKVAKKFKRKLPKSYAFIFEDPKEANEFYNYIALKYQLNNESAERAIPFVTNGKFYFLSFYETEIPTKYLNFLPIIAEASIDIALGGDGASGEVDMTRIGHWYIVLTVSNLSRDDCLAPEYEFRATIITYLKNLKSEYLAVNI